MTETSRPWDGTTTGDATVAPYDAATEFAEILNAMTPGSEQSTNKGGVFKLATGYNDYNMTSPGANTVRVQSGIGMVKGTWHKSDANVDFNIPTPAVSTRVDRIALRKSWVNQTVRLTRIAGTEGAGTPGLTQSDGVTWDVPLWTVSITTGGAMTLADQRRSLGTGTIDSAVLNGTTSVPSGATLSAGAGATVDFTGATVKAGLATQAATGTGPTSLGAGVWTDIGGTALTLPAGNYLIAAVSYVSTGANASDPEMGVADSASNTGGSGLLGGLTTGQIHILANSGGTMMALGFLSTAGQTIKLQQFNNVAAASVIAGSRLIAMRIG